MSRTVEIQEIGEAVSKEFSPKSVFGLQKWAGAVSNRCRTVSSYDPDNCCCAILYGMRVILEQALKGFSLFSFFYIWMRNAILFCEEEKK